MDSSIRAVFNLTPAEKLQLVMDLWDDLASKPESIPLQDWELEEIRRREVNLRAHPETGVPWEEALQRIRQKHGL